MSYFYYFYFLSETLCFFAEAFYEFHFFSNVFITFPWNTLNGCCKVLLKILVCQSSWCSHLLSVFVWFYSARFSWFLVLWMAYSWNLDLCIFVEVLVLSQNLLGLRQGKCMCCLRSPGGGTSPGSPCSCVVSELGSPHVSWVVCVVPAPFIHYLLTSCSDCDSSSLGDGGVSNWGARRQPNLVAEYSNCTNVEGIGESVVSQSQLCNIRTEKKKL